MGASLCEVTQNTNGFLFIKTHLISPHLEGVRSALATGQSPVFGDAKARLKNLRRPPKLTAEVTRERRSRDANH
jgi:hypothetical protein